MSIADLQQQLEALRHAGAHQFDPVRFNYMDALARRAAVQDARVQGILEAKLASALADWTARHTQAHSEAAALPPPAASTTAPLAELLQYLAQHSHGPDERGAAPGTRTDLKAVRQFRDTWSRLSTDKQTRQSLEQAPQNAGPLNSHMLVLRSLALMREISPAYLNRFISYADTLLCLALREAEPAVTADTKPRVRRKRS